MSECFKMFWKESLLCSLLVAFLPQEVISGRSDRSFEIGYNENAFLKDGQPFRYISGTMHYFRVPHQYWEDRLLKMKAAGLNTIQTYIEWSSHEPEEGQFVFDGDLDIVNYIQTAQKLGLFVILRPGPYIDSERDFGGFPYWLLTQDSEMKIRTNAQNYMFYVERYFGKLLPLLKPLLYINGGPILMLQVENEYGSYFACDRDYVQRLAFVMRQQLGFETQLFTTDGGAVSYLKCGYADGIYSTVDFGSGENVTAAFLAQRSKEPAGPLVNSEYYPGWQDHWNFPHSHVDTKAVTKTLEEMLAVNASVNIYVFHGGTSFGFMSGSHNDGKDFTVVPTSYDFDAPIAEGGDLTSKYDAIKETIQKYVNIPDIAVRRKTKKIKFGPVPVKPVYPMLEFMRQEMPSFNSKAPLTFEQLNQFSFCVGYETVVDFQSYDPANLTISGLKDRGYVYVDGVFRAILSRERKIFSTFLLIKKNQTLTILVENQGRVCYGPHMIDLKGIIGNVTLDGKILENWTMYPFQDKKSRKSGIHLPNKPWNGFNEDTKTNEPGIYYGEFQLDNVTKAQDTFLKMDGWTKGFVVINGYNIGRYWPIAGPQVTLYVPGVWLKSYPSKNKIAIAELERAPCGVGPMDNCSIEFLDYAILNGTTPTAQKLPLFFKG